MDVTAGDADALSQLSQGILAVLDNRVTVAAVEDAIDQSLFVSTQAPAKRPMPMDGVVFEVTHDFGENPEPEKMPNRFGYTSKGWGFSGRPIAGLQTRNFMWVSVEPRQNFDAICTELAKHGKVPEGQWLEVIMEQFEPDRRRAIADASWIGPLAGCRSFPCYIRPTEGGLFFICVDIKLNTLRLHWLVEIQ